MTKSNDDHWALFAKSFLDRTRLTLLNRAEYYEQILQPSAEYLGALLGIDQWAVSILKIFNNTISFIYSCAKI